MCGKCDYTSNNAGYLKEVSKSGYDLHGEKLARDDLDECCKIVLGYYCFYDLKAQTLECEEWAEVCDFRKVWRVLKYTNFSIQSKRDDALNALSNLKVEAPFSEVVRFMDNKAYINLSCGAYSDTLRQISEALNYKEREKEKQSRNNPSKTEPEVSNASQTYSFDDALHAFHKGVESLNQYLCKREEVYNRKTFEVKYGLKWCPGKPKPPVIIDPTDIGTGSSTQRTFRDLKVAISNIGLQPESFLFLKSTPEKLFCGKTPTTLASQSESERLQNVDFYILFTGNSYSSCSDSRDMNVVVYGVKDNIAARTTRRPDTESEERETWEESNTFTSSLFLDSLKNKEKNKDHGSSGSKNEDNQEQNEEY